MVTDFLWVALGLLRLLPPPPRPSLICSPRGFSTLGFLEKCTWVLPSSPSVTASFLSVALPQWGQKALVMMLVVLQGNQTELHGPRVQVLASGGPDSPEAGVASQDVAPGLPDQHPVDRQHVEPDLDQHVLERTSWSDPHGTVP
ncbi:hypothetical protein EYF80_062247 [Liparis tanakae]|uniref:Uncharacterized protein n=1 Tax=Liparis tanakae TaxID=230148 RepID=A0A4Z2EFA1_9TELE|nr:hypothetical protein EYF80_062247 [Liparis tanakae]